LNLSLILPFSRSPNSQIKMIELVIFDMAGTSIDEDNIVYKTIHSCIQSDGMEVSLETVLLQGAGKEKWRAISDIIEFVEGQPAAKARIDKIHMEFKGNLESAYQNTEMKIFPSVQTVMEYLRKRNIKIAFNTGYNSHIARMILSKVNIEIGKDVDVLVTADDVTSARPAPDMIYLTRKIHRNFPHAGPTICKNWFSTFHSF